MTLRRSRIWHWAALVLTAFELIGVWSRTRNDTLSEYVWSKTQNPGVRSVVAGLAAWLPYHFTYGNGIPLNRVDALFVLGGVMMGYHSWKQEQ